VLALDVPLEKLMVLVEPPAPVPLAALFERQIALARLHFGVILSGGNVDLEHLPWLQHAGQG